MAANSDKAKNITFSAKSALLEKARAKATLSGSTLNDLFRQWLEEYVASGGLVEQYDQLMKELPNLHTTRKFSRDEMNER